MSLTSHDADAGQAAGTRAAGAREAGAGRLEWMLRLGIALAVLAVFAAVLKAGFVNWDDPKNIFENPHLGLGAKQLQWMFTDASYVRRYLPLGWLSYSVDRAWFGGGPGSYHAGNLLLHVANALWIFAILKRLLSRCAGAASDPARLLWCAALGSLAWAVHPLRVEPVAWASARIYCVAGFFAFASVWAYLRATEGEVIHRGALGLAVGAYGLSVFTYPITLGVPAVFVALDIFALRRLPENPMRWWSPAARRVWIEKALFLIPAALMLAATLWARFTNGHVERVVGLEQFGVSQRILQACFVVAYFVWKPWLPGSLAPKYPDLLDVDPASLPFLVSAAVVGGITVVLWVRRRAWPMLAGAWLVHLVLLVPVLGLTEHPHHTFDRYSYFQGALWSLLLAVGLWKALKSERWRRVGPVALAACILLFGSLSVSQVTVWANSLNVQTRMVESLGEHPEAALHETMRGVWFMERKENAAAEAAFRHAIQLNPGLPEPWRDLGDVLADVHQPAAATVCYREAIRLNPADPGARLNLSIVLGGSGRLTEAADELRAVLRLNPRHAGAHHNLAVTLKLLGQTEEAQRHLAESAKLKAQSSK